MMMVVQLMVSVVMITIKTEELKSAAENSRELQFFLSCLTQPGLQRHLIVGSRTPLTLLTEPSLLLPHGQFLQTFLRFAPTICHHHHQHHYHYHATGT